MGLFTDLVIANLAFWLLVDLGLSSRKLRRKACPVVLSMLKSEKIEYKQLNL